MNQFPPILPRATTATDILGLLAVPRVAPYKTHFAAQNDEQQLGSYLWAQALSASLHPFIGLAEIVLRNAIHRALSEHCSRGASTSCAWYDRAWPHAIPLRGKSHERIEKLLSEGTPAIRKTMQPTPDKVVAELTFGFWPNVMESLSQVVAPRAFARVFAAHPHSKPRHWSHPANKLPVVLRLKRLQDVRNRVCHFEPVWKPHWLGVSGTNWSHAVAGLRTLHRDMQELLGWCSPTAVEAYRASFGWNWFNTLCTTHAVRAFMDDHAACARLASFVPSCAAIAAPASSV